MPTIGVVKQHMDDALEAVRREFTTVRTGKATPTILDTVRVEAYGAQMPLNQVATISTPESSLIVVQPFDR
jgi:ribosome recycling factor